MRKYSLQISIILAMIILLFFIYGCGGTRQTNTQHKDSIHIENSYLEGLKIVLGNSFTYTPFDALKPMKIEGKVYENAIVSNDKSKTFIKWKKQTEYITRTITIHRTTEKSDNTILWIFIALIICGFIFLWFSLPKIKTGI